MSRISVHPAVPLLAFLILLGSGRPAFAFGNSPALSSQSGGREEPLPQELEGVGLTEHLGSSLPLGLTFTNDDGRPVRLAELFRDRPVVLTLGYYECPMLCDVVLNGLVDSIHRAKLVVGRDLDIVSVSIDPKEDASLAAGKKKIYLADLAQPGAERSWHFLTGQPDRIRELTNAVGFQYRYDEKQKQYAHPVLVTLTTAEGRISRYLYGVQPEPRTLRLSLVEASEGKVGSIVDRLVLTCYHYDPDSHSYAFTALTIMRIAGAITALVLASVLASFWMREARRRKRTA